MTKPRAFFLMISSVMCLVALGVCGCQRASRSASAASGKKVYRIAVIPKGTSHDFWYSVHAGARKAANELDDVEITWTGPESEGNTRRQIEIVEGFIANGYDGICLAPLDAVALRKPVEQAIANGIPVVIFDSALADLSGTVSYVATNNYRGGKVAGDYLAKLLDGKGEIILMRYAVNSESTEQREQGFLDAIAEHPELHLLSADKHAGPDEQGAIELGENLLTDFGDRVDGIFCPNQSTASGMLTVLERDIRGLAGKVKFVGFDAGEHIAQGLKKGILHATVLQDPVQMGYDAVRTMYDHLRGKEVPSRVEVPETLATHEDFDDPRIQQLLYPETVE